MPQGDSCNLSGLVGDCQLQEVTTVRPGPLSPVPSPALHPARGRAPTLQGHVSSPGDKACYKRTSLLILFIQIKKKKKRAPRQLLLVSGRSLSCEAFSASESSAGRRRWAGRDCLRTCASRRHHQSGHPREREAKNGRGREKTLRQGRRQRRDPVASGGSGLRLALPCPPGSPSLPGHSRQTRPQPPRSKLTPVGPAGLPGCRLPRPQPLSFLLPSLGGGLLLQNQRNQGNPCQGRLQVTAGADRAGFGGKGPLHAARRQSSLLCTLSTNFVPCTTGYKRPPHPQANSVVRSPVPPARGGQAENSKGKGSKGQICEDVWEVTGAASGQTHLQLLPAAARVHPPRETQPVAPRSPARALSCGAAGAPPCILGSLPQGVPARAQRAVPRADGPVRVLS